jgi:uncharacterized protein YhaN
MPQAKRKPAAKPRKKFAAKRPVKRASAKSATKQRSTAKASATARVKPAPKRKAEAKIDPRWEELVTELRAKERARDAIDPFRKGWASSDKQIATWKQLNDAVKEVRDRMDKLIAGLPH